MAKISVSIQTETAEIPHTYDCGIGLEQNINTICSGVSRLVGIPAIYALSLPDGTILKEETATQDTITKNPKLTLVVHPHKLKENASLKDVLQKIRDLDSDNQTTLKRAVFDLVEGLKNNDYANLFVKQNGTARLIDTVEKLKVGNTLAYTLNALVTLMNSNIKFPAVRSTLMKKVFEIVKDGNINVARPAMQFLALLLGSKIHDMSAILFLVSRKWQMNWPQVISFLTSSDIGIQVATLAFLNSFLRAIREEVFVGTNSKATMRRQFKSIELLTDVSNSHSHLSPEEDIAEFENYIFEILDVVQVVLKQAGIDHNAFLKEEIVKFQCLYVSYLIQHKSIAFDEKDSTHFALIQRLWKAVNSDQEFPGLNSAKWIDLGFQGKNPISDLRAAGLLGLEHLVYFAETYPQNFKKILADQNTLPVERQYPVATAGINITNLMGNVFTTADKVYPMIFEPNGLLNMYCIIFEKLDVEWYKQNATYMQFNALFETIKTRLASILAYGKISVELFKKLMLEVDSSRLKLVVPTVMRDSVGANLAKSFPKLNLLEGPKSADPAPQLQVRSLHQDSASPRRATAEPTHRRTGSNQNIEVRRNSNESSPGRDSRSSSNETIESPRSLQVMSSTMSPRPLPSVPSVPKMAPVAPAKLPPPPPPLVLRANSKGTMEPTAPPLPPPRSASPSPGHSPQVSPRLTMPPQYAPPLPPNMSHSSTLPPNSMPPPPPVVQRVKK